MSEPLVCPHESLELLWGVAVGSVEQDRPRLSGFHKCGGVQHEILQRFRQRRGKGLRTVGGNANQLPVSHEWLGSFSLQACRLP